MSLRLIRIKLLAASMGSPEGSMREKVYLWAYTQLLSLTPSRYSKVE
jgi:hypothetical protein